MIKTNIGFIGAGHMAGAMIDGLLASGMIEPGFLGVYDVSRERVEHYRGRGLRVYEAIPGLVASCAVVFLCVKPQVVAEVLPLVRQGLRPETVVVSIAAGWTLQRLHEGLGESCRVLIAMPNTPIELGWGAVALARTEPATGQDMKTVTELLSVCAIVEEIPPEAMNAITVVSGSVPAFFYQMADTIISNAVELGLNADTARALLCQTMIGSAHMLLKHGDARKLAGQVATPGGTTAAALAEMERLGHYDALRAGMQVCVERARQLGEK